MSQFKKTGGRYGMHSGSAKYKHLEVVKNLWVQGGLIGPTTPGVIFYVDGNRAASGDGKSWSSAFKTIQEAHDAATSKRGDIILIAPKQTGEGRYNENVVITKESLTIMGIGGGQNNPSIRASGATTKYPITGEIEGRTISGCGMLIMAKNTTVSNLAFDASGTYVGIYIGDGYRINESYDYDPEYCIIKDCFFKYGTVGIYMDGCDSAQQIYGNYFYNQADEGVYICPGGIQQARRIYIYNNCFEGCEDYGVRTYSHANVNQITVGPFNTFKDQNTGSTEMTNPVKFGAVCTGCSMHYNACATTNDPTGAATHLMGGNADGLAMNTPLHIHEA